MSRSWRTTGSLWQSPKVSGDICWKCRLQLQQRNFHVSRVAAPSGPNSKKRNQSIDRRFLPSSELAKWPLSSTRKLSTKSVTLEKKYLTSREQGSRVKTPPSRSSSTDTLPYQSILREGGLASLKASTSYESDVGLRENDTGSFRLDRVPQPVVNAAIRKSKRSQALQAGSTWPSNMMWRTVPSSTPYNIGTKRKPISSRREFSTVTDSKPLSDNEFPVSFNKLYMQHAVPAKGRSIREELRLWQEQQDAVAKSDPSKTDTHGSKSGIVQDYIQRAPGDNLAGEPAHIDNNAFGPGAAFRSDDHVIETNENFPTLRPGDMVEMNMEGRTVLAIHIRTFPRQAQFYTIMGKWVQRRIRHLHFAVPQFVPRAEATRLVEFLPQEELAHSELDQLQQLGAGVPRSVGAHMVEKMLEFVRASDRVYRSHADRIDMAHEIVADEKYLHSATLVKIASKVLEMTDTSKIPFSSLWAVHRGLIQLDIGFRVDNKDHWRTGRFEVISKRDVKLVIQVRDWLREYQEQLIAQGKTVTPKKSDHGGAAIIGSFVEKARMLIAESRKTRPLTPTGNIGISLIQPELAIAGSWDTRKSCTKHVVIGQFTDDEETILRFIDLWAARAYLKSTSRLNAMGSMILRVVGMYEGFELDEPTGFTFLQEMGVFAPWENRMAFHTRLALPGYHVDNITEDLLASADRSIQNWKPRDKMAALRKDWKDLEVFCVDGATAEEIDDGFSLEYIAGDSDNYWVHIHVANPTAYMDPDHALAKYAARMVESVYFPEKAYHMLSSKITKKFFSLDSNRSALTFSAKLNSQGEIIDINIASSIVRKVTFYTPEFVLRELATENAELRPVSNITVGHYPPETLAQTRRADEIQTMDSDQKKALRKLLELGAARHRQRMPKGAVLSGIDRAEVYVHWLNTTSPYRRKIRRVEGDPTISVSGIIFENIPTIKSLGIDSAPMLVPHMMILACEVAALWTSRRGIPMLYRGTLADPEFPSASEYKNRELDLVTQKNGLAPFQEVRRYMGLAGPGYSSTDPVPHQVIGTDAYTKVTSPLRRYGDMLAHWQIEAALLHEAETGSLSIGKRDHSFLAFSREQIHEMIPEISGREATISHAKHTVQNHWIVQAIFRAFYFKEALLPDTFEVYCWTGPLHGSDSMCITKELGLDAFISSNTPSAKAVEGVQVGDWWEAKIDRVDPYRRSIWMTPLRLIERTAPEGRKWV